MKRFQILAIAAFISCSQCAIAQTFYVDNSHGDDRNAGTAKAALASLCEAVKRANLSRQNQPIVIKVAPGLYTLKEPITISGHSYTAKYSVEALVMPDDSGWTPAKMPVIQCIADGNRAGKLEHASTAFQIQRNHVSIRGLKFIGDPHPASVYYYAIERKDSTLTGLEITQCYFLGDRYSMPMQGGVFAQGVKVSVDHCIFYGVKNAVLVFVGLKYFSLTHSIIYGSYEGAVWYGYGLSGDVPFTFSDNVITGCNYFWVGYRGKHPNYKFTNSQISGNAHYMGFNEQEILPDTINKPMEERVRKSGKVSLVEADLKGLPLNYLNLAASSAGSDIEAGLFKTKRH
ncbi:MAG TPA: hypothetical protein VHB54_14365 [Mucilaginibacter sp.]|nr:hypothetical protein [Mucilaginibacter sp.]